MKKFTLTLIIGLILTTASACAAAKAPTVILKLDPSLSVDTTQEDLNALKAIDGYIDARLDEAGRVEITLNEDKHSELVDEVEEMIQATLIAIPEDPEYPNISSIGANSTYTEFTIYCTDDSLNEKELQLADAIYQLGERYSIRNSGQIGTIHVVYIDSTNNNISEGYSR